MNIYIKDFGKIFTKGVTFGLGFLSILLLAGISYAAFTNFTSLQATNGETLTATKWNDLVDAVQDKYLTDGSEVLTNKTWDGKPVYRRVYNVNPSVGYTNYATILNVTPVGIWSLTNAGEYWYGEVAHSSPALSVNYSSTTGVLKIYQGGWDNTTFVDSTFVFEYIKN